MMRHSLRPFARRFATQQSGQQPFPKFPTFTPPPLKEVLQVGGACLTFVSVAVCLLPPISCVPAVWFESVPSPSTRVSVN